MQYKKFKLNMIFIIFHKYLIRHPVEFRMQKYFGLKDGLNQYLITINDPVIFSGFV